MLFYWKEHKRCLDFTTFYYIWGFYYNIKPQKNLLFLPLGNVPLYIKITEMYMQNTYWVLCFLIIYFILVATSQELHGQYWSFTNINLETKYALDIDHEHFYVNIG